MQATATQSGVAPTTSGTPRPEKAEASTSANPFKVISTAKPETKPAESKTENRSGEKTEVKAGTASINGKKTRQQFFQETLAQLSQPFDNGSSRRQRDTGYVDGGDDGFDGGFDADA